MNKLLVCIFILLSNNSAMADAFKMSFCGNDSSDSVQVVRSNDYFSVTFKLNNESTTDEYKIVREQSIEKLDDLDKLSKSAQYQITKAIDFHLDSVSTDESGTIAFIGTAADGDTAYFENNGSGLEFLGWTSSCRIASRKERSLYEEVRKEIEKL